MTGAAPFDAEDEAARRATAHCCITVPADPFAIRDALERIRDHFAPHCGSELTGRLELVVAEVLNNIAEHGATSSDHGGGKRSIVRVGVAEMHSGVYCIVADKGGPVPPGCLIPRSLPNASNLISAMAEGGYGWFMIQTMVEKLSYNRDENRNVLSFLIPRQDQPAAA